MKKTALSFLLALTLVLGVVVVAAPQAQAAAHSHCICGNKAAGMKDHSCDLPADQGGWQALTKSGDNLLADGVAVTIDNNKYQLSAGKYYLATSIQLSYPITAASGATVSICLNGCTLSGYNATGVRGRIFSQEQAGTINLTDCAQSQGRVTTKCTQTGTVGFFNDNAANFNLYAGVLTGNTVSNAAGGTLRFTNGNMNMYGGTIQGGSSGTLGGNLYAASGIFNMYGGSIINGATTNGSNSSATSGGGNVRITSTATFNMYGGTISGGTATKRGGNILANGPLNIYGGTISGGSDSVGASIYVDDNKGKLNGGRSLTCLDQLIEEGKLTLDGAVVMCYTDNAVVKGQYKLYDNMGTAAKPLAVNIATAHQNDLVIDLNGHNLYASFTLQSGKKVYGMDTANDSFDEGDCGKLYTSTAVEPYIQVASAGNKHYIKCSEGSNTYTFHRVSVAIQNISLEFDDDSVNVGYTAHFKADEKIKSLMQSDDKFGFEVYLLKGAGQSGSKSTSEFEAGQENIMTLRLSNIMERSGALNAAQALADIKAKTFIDIGDITVESKEYAFNLQEMIEAADTKLSQLEQEDQDALVATYKNYVADMKNWNIPNIKKEANVSIPSIEESEQNKLRDKVALYMEQMCTLQWKLENDIARSCGGSCHDDGYILAGTFAGMPYTHRAASLEKFLSRLDSDGYLALKDGETLTDIGNDCADAVYWAWSQVSAGISFTLTNNAMCYNGTIPVGDYVVNGQVTSSTYDTNTVCTQNGDQVMYEAYALMQKGDAMLRAIPNGHMLMVTSVSVVRNADDTINGSTSKIYFMEQGYKPEAEEGSCARANGSITFSNAFEKDYIPLTIAAFTQGADPEQVFACVGDNMSLADMVANGYVTSNYRINSVTLKVTQNGNTVGTFTEFPYSGNTHNGNVVQLSVFETAVAGLSLTKGSQYTYEIIVHIGDADISAQTVTFTA